MSKIRCWECINNVCVEKPRCSINSCKIDCASSPDGFCCIQNLSINRLLQVMGLQANPLNNGIDICQSKSECEQNCFTPGAYGIIWSWTQSCRPSQQPIAVVTPVRYNDLRPSDIISFTVRNRVGCADDTYVRAINNRINRRYDQPYLNNEDFLSFQGGPVGYQIVKVSDYPNGFFLEGN